MFVRQTLRFISTQEGIGSVTGRGKYRLCYDAFCPAQVVKDVNRVVSLHEKQIRKIPDIYKSMP